MCRGIKSAVVGRGSFTRMRTRGRRIGWSAYQTRRRLRCRAASQRISRWSSAVSEQSRERGQRLERLITSGWEKSKVRSSSNESWTIVGGRGVSRAGGTGGVLEQVAAQLRRVENGRAHRSARRRSFRSVRSPCDMPCAQVRGAYQSRIMEFGLADRVLGRASKAVVRSWLRCLKRPHPSPNRPG